MTWSVVGSISATSSPSHYVGVVFTSVLPCRKMPNCRWVMDVKIESMGDRVVGTELVGRGAHLAALHAAATDLREVARVVLVAGEAGIGKSVLIETFGRQLKDHDVRVWVGGCVELAGDPIPYAPVMQVIRTIERSGTAAEDVLGSGPQGPHQGWGIPA